MLSLSVVIPNYNGIRHLERLLPGLCRHAPRGTQVLVVDDASTDGSAAWTRRHFPQVEVLALKQNGGFCQAVNAGLEHARGEVIELLNNDTEVSSGWAEACLPHFADPTVGSVAPLVVRMDQPDVIDSAGMAYHLCGWAYDRGHGRKLDAHYLSACEVFGASGSSGFYRRSALEQTGGLLPEYGAYFEDTDLAFRLRWAGYRCVYEPAARVLHRGSASYGQHSPRVTRHLARNEELAFWINLSGKDLFWGFLPHLAFLLVRGVRHALTGRFSPFVRGKLDALRSEHLIRQRRAAVRRLARTAVRPCDLAVQHSWSVVGQGVEWLRRRRCA